MSLSVAIMAHPQRRRMVEKLIGKLDRKPRVAWDTDNDRWDTGHRALLAHDPDADHHLVLQDDAVTPRHLIEGCEAMLAHVPSDAPVSLYMGRWRHRPNRFSMRPMVEAAQSRGASFAVFGGPWWGVGVILPVGDIEAVVAYGDENPKRQPNYDLRIAQFYDSKGIDCWYTMPSMVDHMSGPSLVGRRGQRRHAMWYHDGTLDGLRWDGGIVTAADVDVPRFPVTP